MVSLRKIIGTCLLLGGLVLFSNSVSNVEKYGNQLEMISRSNSRHSGEELRSLEAKYSRNLLYVISGFGEVLVGSYLIYRKNR